MPRGVYERKGLPVAKTSDDVQIAANERVGGPAHRTTPARLDDVASVDHGYMAMKPMKVAGVKINPGELVPDAASWRNLHNYISSGYLAVVSTPPVVPDGGRF